MTKLKVLVTMLVWGANSSLIPRVAQTIGITASTATLSLSSNHESATAVSTDTASIGFSTSIDDLLSTSMPAATGLTNNPSNGPRVHLVKVGVGGFHFKPDQLTGVSIGDVVTFEFYPLDHSVARAEYGSACVPYEYTGRDKTGFWSGTQWVHAVEDITHWNLTINSTEPIFFYCAAPNSCKGELMVGAINPNSTQTLDAQIRAARAADFSLAPGDPIPREASSTLAAPSGAGDDHTLKFPEGAVAGIVVGGAIFLAICAWMLFCLLRKRAGESATRREAANTQRTTFPTPIGPMRPNGFGSPTSPLQPLGSGCFPNPPSYITPHPYVANPPSIAPPPVELGPGTKGQND